MTFMDTKVLAQFSRSAALDAAPREPRRRPQSAFRTCNDCYRKLPNTAENFQSRNGRTEGNLCKTCKVTRNRFSVYRMRYGLTRERATELMQRGCAICRAKDPGTRKGWQGDHDHKTGHFRGFLCGRCNLGLGMFDDDVDMLARAMQYVSRGGLRDEVA